MSPTEVAHTFLAAMEKMDYDTALGYVADDIEYVNGSAPAVSGPKASFWMVAEARRSIPQTRTVRPL